MSGALRQRPTVKVGLVAFILLGRMHCSRRMEQPWGELVERLFPGVVFAGNARKTAAVTGKDDELSGHCGVASGETGRCLDGSCHIFSTRGVGVYQDVIENNGDMSLVHELVAGKAREDCQLFSGTGREIAIGDGDAVGSGDGTHNCEIVSDGDGEVVTPYSLAETREGLHIGCLVAGGSALAGCQ